MSFNKRNPQNGQSLVEYVALTALVAIVSIGTVKAFGGKVRTRLNQITTTFDRNIQQGLKVKQVAGHEEEEDGEDVGGPGLRLPPSLRMPGIIRLPSGFGR